MDLRELATNLQGNAQQLAANLQRAGSRVAELCQQALQPHPGVAPLLASVGARFGGGRPAAAAAPPRPQPLADVAFANPEVMKTRLAGVPVFAVVNGKGEFVLVSSEEAEERQLGLFFFSEAEAEAMLKTVRAAHPKLGKGAKVATTSMDRVYEFATTPREATGTQGVRFRFVPDPAQVDAALQLYRHAGVSASGFQGVPLFQAEGLTIKGEVERYTPLFFSKDDLDAALGAAFNAKGAAAAADARAKAERAAGELAAAEAEAAAAGGERERRGATRRAAEARARLQKYEARAAEAAKSQKLPRVDVGSLEEVLGRMEADSAGEWADVVLVPARSVAGAGAAK